MLTETAPKCPLRPVTDAGGNLWTCYHQRGGFVTGTLAKALSVRPLPTRKALRKIRVRRILHRSIFRFTTSAWKR